MMDEKQPQWLKDIKKLQARSDLLPKVMRALRKVLYTFDDDEKEAAWHEADAVLSTVRDLLSPASGQGDAVDKEPDMIECPACVSIGSEDGDTRYGCKACSGTHMIPKPEETTHD